LNKESATNKWLITRYSPVSLFSLRSTYATSKGGKTLLVPTPYAIKMALIDACFRVHLGLEAEHAARRVFDSVKAQRVRVRPPEECIVQNTFLRVLQPARDSEDGDDASQPFTRTIAYREFVFFRGEIEIAIGLNGLSASGSDELAYLFAHVNYFGKRGSLWQFLDTREHRDALPSGFSLQGSEISQYPLDIVNRYRTTEYLDDFGPKLCNAKDGFERISTYHAGEIKLGEHRVLLHTLLPYERKTGGRHFTQYRRIV
jgi:hypothetical protein